MSIYFTVLNEGYVQRGNYKVAKSYKPGYTHALGIPGSTDTSNTNLVPLPDNFYKQEYQFYTPKDPTAAGFDAENVYNQLAYNQPTPVYSTQVTIPAVRKVTFMYMHGDVGSSVGQSTLVMYEGPIANTTNGTVGVPQDGKLYSLAEYYAEFAPVGFERYGKVLPAKVSRADVDELRVVTGSYKLDDGSQVDGITLYLSHMWLNNSLPIFDAVYMAASGTAEGTISGRVVTWLQSVVSENRAFMNFTDGTNGNDAGARTGHNPLGTLRVNQEVSLDSDTLYNATAYNVTNLIRN
jgi:hypothetical protein